MEKIKLHEHEIEIFISSQKIAETVKTMAKRISEDFQGKKPLFLIVLNGAFMFASDLLKEITITCELSFVKIASYQGTEQTDLKELIGLNEDLRGRAVIVVEDIVDSGHTLQKIMSMLKEKNAETVHVASMFFKPGAMKFPELTVDYVGMSIANDFIVGYGLDYDGIGRNLNSVYKIVE